MLQQQQQQHMKAAEPVCVQLPLSHLTLYRLFWYYRSVFGVRQVRIGASTQEGKACVLEI